MAQNQKDVQQAQSENRFIVPTPEWQSTDQMELRGDLLEALEHTISSTYNKLEEACQEFNKVLGALQQIIGRNINTGKIKLKYVWNNGVEATEEEGAAFKKQYDELLARRKQEEVDRIKNDIAMANAEKTGLVGVDGAPLGSDTPLADAPEIEV